MHESELRMSTSSLDPVQDFYVNAYAASELRTFHCERVRKMPLSGLDPSMLIGFLCKDEADWYDFRRRVGELPRTVFSVQEEPPTWPSDLDDNMGLESISEPDPDDLLLDDMDIEDEKEHDEDAEEQFFDTHSASASTSSTSASGSGSGSVHRRDGRGTSEEVDTEEDPVDPITPLPNARFSLGPRPTHQAKDVGEDEHDDGEHVEREMYEEGDIEDDWIDPSVPTPIPTDTPPILVSSSVPAVVYATTSKKSRKGRKEIPVPVPLVKVPTPSSNRSQSQNQQEHFPFPMTQRSAEEASPTRPEHRTRHASIKNTGKRMHTARARDGGRTQSGGVKGILPEDSG
ncbi:hypothetical protein H0H87_007545 [Tephrocybe sp. NHM501043]|nr:hypothetical protein H0H87_007545 [Tephrocybe sp. NHM501043]